MKTEKWKRILRSIKHIFYANNSTCCISATLQYNLIKMHYFTHFIDKKTNLERLFVENCMTKQQDAFLPGNRHIPLPWWLSGKQSTCFAGDLGSVLGSGRSPEKGNGNLLQYSCLENSMDRRAWRATVHWVAKSWITEWLTLSEWHIGPCRIPPGKVD